MSMSDHQPLSLGISSFRSLRIKRAVYVDKTHMIRSLADPSGEGDKWFLARPRRFGKSLLISTFESLFKYGLRDFEGLAVTREWTDRCYDVVRLDFSEIPSCRDPDAFGVGFRALIAIKFKPLGFEAEPLDGAFFQKFSGWLEARERRSLVLLIDECDAPLTHSIEDPTLFREIEEKLRPFFSALKARSDCLRFLFMTGITRFGYAQALKGFDGVADISFDPAYGTLLGFTDAELERCFAGRLQPAAERLGLPVEKLRARLKASYAGYCFDAEGQTEVYSPWSVLSFLRAPELGFRNHWWLTAGASSDLLKKHVRHRMRFACRSGRFDGTVKVPFSRLESALQWEDLESPQLLQQTGCLSVKGRDLSGEVELGYPNLEVAASLAQLAEEELTRDRGSSRPDLVRALTRGCVATVVDYLNTVVSSMDGRAFSLGSETECRFLLQMVLMKAALQPRVEVPSPDGRTRLEVLAGDRHWVFEVRFAQGALELAGQLEGGARRMCESSGRDRLHGNKCLHAALIFDSAQRRFVALEAEEGASC